MKHAITLLAAGFLSCPLLCGAEGPPAKSVAISTGQVASFEVNFSRVTGAATGAAIAGLVGAAIQEGKHTKDDAAKTREVATKLAHPECDTPMIRAATDALVAGGFAIDDAGAGARAVLFIQDCGLRLTDRSSDVVAAFVNVRLEYSPPGAAKPAWKEDITITGREQRAYSEFAKQDGLAQHELDETLKRAGVRVANKIIYQK